MLMELQRHSYIFGLDFSNLVDCCMSYDQVLLYDETISTKETTNDLSELFFLFLIQLRYQETQSYVHTVF